MRKRLDIAIKTAIALMGLGAAVCQADINVQHPALSVQNMPKVGTIDERFQSYNIEMLEVTGGNFWKPYGAKTSVKPATGSTPSGMDPSLYAYRPPLDLSNPRLRKLAAALSPAYVRSSGTWANTSYFPNSDTAPTTPPIGFQGVLTHAQWKGLVDFSNAVKAPIITSFATSPGVRDSKGRWTSDQALRFLQYTQSVGGHIAAAEFMNEPSFAAMGGAPKGYNAADYGRDFKIFHDFVKQNAPKMLILGPGSVGETDGDWGLGYGNIPLLNTKDLLTASGPGVDAFSYHHYGASSKRCAPMGQTTEQDALTEGWLSRTDQTLSFYRKLRDQFEPGKPLWITETADAACGGNEWAGTFLDTFRYLDQLGRLAKQGVQVVAHNTLVASDYGLLDENTLTPKPNYWGALLWRKFMGTTVLDSGIVNQAGLHVYAHCERGTPGGVSLMVLNTDKSVKQTLDIPVKSQRYTLSSKDLLNKTVTLNGKQLTLGKNDALPEIEGVATKSGKVEFDPASITFLTLPEAANKACQ